MPQLDMAIERPIDLVATLRPLVRGQGDRTIRIRPGQAWWTVRTTAGPATAVIRLLPDRLLAETFGPGAVLALERVPDLIGAAAEAASPRDLPPDGHRLVAALARAHPGVRIARSHHIDACPSQQNTNQLQQLRIIIDDEYTFFIHRNCQLSLETLQMGVRVGVSRVLICDCNAPSIL